MKLIRKFIFTLFLISIIPVFSQQNITLEKKRVFDSLEKRKLTNVVEIYNNGIEMRKYAQTNEEFAKAYHNMGDGKYKDGDYLAAIIFLEKANKYIDSNDNYTKPSDKKQMQIYINALLALSYSYASLPTEANNVINKIKKTIDIQNANEATAIPQLIAKSYEIQEKYCEAIPYRKQALDVYNKDYKFDDEVSRKSLLIFGNITLAYLNIKCNNLSTALKHLDIVEKLYDELGTKKPTYIIEQYYLVKALIALKENDKISAKQWFRKSYKTVSLTENKSSIKSILLEMQASGLFETPEEKNEIYEALIKIQNFQTESTKQVVKKEIENKNLKLKNEKENCILYLLISVILILIITFILLYYKYQNKKLQYNYQRLIKNIDKKKEQKSNTLDGNITPKSISEIDHQDENIFELNILKKLDKLEEKLLFTSKDASATQLAALLKITPRNLSYILKKYRNEDFYSYLNTLRIDYIIATLQEHPEYLNYKIAVLADMCGYSSHSHFTVMFKSKTGLSPSQYIDLLRKEKK